MLRYEKQRRRRKGRWAFSLVELVIVVTIIGMISSIAVPRLTGASKNARSNALQATLTSVRKAIDMYYAEHDQYPGYTPGTTTPNGAQFVNQLLMFSDVQGNTRATSGAPFVYGPYLRDPFPVNPTNNLATVTVKAVPSDPSPVLGSVGWVAVLSHGYFGVSATIVKLKDIGIENGRVQQIVRGPTL